MWLQLPLQLYRELFQQPIPWKLALLQSFLEWWDFLRRKPLLMLLVVVQLVLLLLTLLLQPPPSPILMFVMLGTFPSH